MTKNTLARYFTACLLTVISCKLEIPMMLAIIMIWLVVK